MQHAAGQQAAVLLGLEVKAAQPGAYLAMCLVLRDQNDDLREWIEYHTNLGAGKFYIFDDNSTAPADQDILDLVEAGAASMDITILRGSKCY